HSIIVCGLSMGAILDIHHAARHPREVTGMGLLRADAVARRLGHPLVQRAVCAHHAKVVRRSGQFCRARPWGIKDARLRALVERATSGDSSMAGIAALPGSLLLELRWLVQHVKDELARVRQPALIVHPREDDRASLRNMHYLQSQLGG